MFKHLRPVWAEINIDNLKNNIKEIRKISNSKDIIAIIKADAYGHGALDIAPILLENGATRLAVAVISEAVEIRKLGIKCPIMILGFTPPSLIDNILRYNIEQTVFDYEYAKKLSKMAMKYNKVAKIHIAVDTGMGRIGFIPNKDSVKIVKKISELPNIEIEGIFSHFSTADEENKDYSKAQLDKFNWFYKNLKNQGVKINIRHISNSAAITDMPETHFEAVRPGIILYGYYPSDYVSKEKINLKPVMSLKTNIVHVKKLPCCEYIGYGRKFKTERETIIATLPVGYADGYSRNLSNKINVIVNGKFAPVIGNICMDQCMIDITDIPNTKVGDEVILMGEQENLKITAEDIASKLGTISYDVICMISKRVPRVYIESGEVIKIRNYI